MHRGHEVSKFSTAEQGLATFRTRQHSLVITDYMLDGMDGIEFTRRIRELPGGDLTVIVVITALDEVEDLQRVLDAGADDYLLKPIEKKMIQIRMIIAENLVRNKVKRKQALEEIRRSRQEYKRLFDESPLAMMIHDGERFLFLNASARELLGIPVDSGEQQPLLIDFIHPSCVPDVKKRIDFMRQTRQAVELHEEKMIRQDGQVIDVLAKGMLVRFGDKEAIQSFAIDITEKKKNEEMLHILSSSLEQSSVSVMITDVHGRIEYVNQKFMQVTDYSLDELKGQDPRLIQSGLHDPAMYENLWQTVKTGSQWQGEICHKTKQGELVWEYVSISPIYSSNGEIIRFFMAAENITELKSNRDALRDSEERFALASIGSHDGLWDWKIHEDEVFLSPRWKQTLGFDENEIKNHMDEWYQRVHPDDIALFKGDLQDHLRGFSPHFENECRVLHKDGNYRWILSRAVAMFDNSGSAYRIAGSITDITSRKKAEEKIIHDAFYDTLTNLPNLKLFMDRLTSVIARARRHDNYFVAVLFVDIDRLKVINDSLGHRIGDLVIKEIGSRLMDCVRSGDTVARISGDSFVALLDDLSDFSDGIYIVKRMQKKVNQPVYVEGHEIVVTVSIGISVNSVKNETADDLIRFANIAMSKVKAQGRNNFRRYQQEMSREVLERLDLENRLYHAIKNEELSIHYQPQVDIQKGTLVGFEALLRWHNADLGSISPGQFIPIAEDTGLIVPIGEWVLREVCRQIDEWRRVFHVGLMVAVNFSARQFQQENLLEMIQSSMDQYQIDTSLLDMEITESIVMDNIDSAISKINSIKELGIKISIDDFGTGYSSLNYLKQLPLDKLKIDQSFVCGVPRDPDNMAITNAIIGLARSLGLDLIAEGVETVEQLMYLKENGCYKIQGYLFSKPLSVPDVNELIRAGEFPMNIYKKIFPTT